MNKAFVVFLTVVALTSAKEYPKGFGRRLLADLLKLDGAQPAGLFDEVPAVEDNEVYEDIPIYQANDEEVPPPAGVENYGLILNHEAKKAVRDVIKQLPCGWPEAGIPPLAPYRRERLDLDIKRSVVESLTTLIRFKVDGLEHMLINKLKVSYIAKKVKYSFTIPKLTISGQYVTDTFIRLMNEYGVDIEYDGSGDFEVVLLNLNVSGTFKYRMPFLFGSIRIYKFHALVTLGGAESHISGLMGNGRVNHFVNDEIEDTIMWAVNSHQPQISAEIENVIVPNVNNKLKGHKIWTVLGIILGSSSGTCIPPPDPWA